MGWVTALERLVNSLVSWSLWRPTWNVSLDEKSRPSSSLQDLKIGLDISIQRNISGTCPKMSHHESLFRPTSFATCFSNWSDQNVLLYNPHVVLLLRMHPFRTNLNITNSICTWSHEVKKVQQNRGISVHNFSSPPQAPLVFLQKLLWYVDLIYLWRKSYGTGPG